MGDLPLGDFLARVRAALADGSFVRLNLGVSARRDGILNIFIRPVRLRSGPMLSFLYRHPTRDVTKNFAPEEGVALLGELLGHDFLNAFLSTTKGTAQLTFRKGRPTRLVLGKPEVSAPPDLSHDRRKERAVPACANWLVELGVTAADGTVKAGMEAKYRQIHRFVEIVRPLLAEAGIGPEDPVRLTDMGCGKGYLTFAIHDHLRRTRPPGVEVEVRGVEARNELATLCRAVAERCGREGLDFVAGDIAGASVPGGGVLVALHACDTATDEALAKGVAARAALLLVSPCCHREVRQRLVPPPVLAGALGHGIFRERQAEFATDALRAALLEWAGYDTRVFEFVATEHTAKNLMIAAVRRRGPFDREARAGEAARLAAFYGITAQRLADLLGFPLGGSASAAA